MSQWKSLIEDMTRDVSDVMHRKRGLRFEKSQLVEFCRRRKTVDFRGSPKPGQWPCSRCRTWFGADGKVSIKRWYLSPYVEKPFNSKVIKSFVPELRSRQVFFVFRDSYVIYALYEHYERFAYRYGYVYFTYSCMGMLHSLHVPDLWLCTKSKLRLFGYSIY